MSSWSSDLTARQERLRAITAGRVVTVLLLALLLATVAFDLTDPAGRAVLTVTGLVHLAVQALAYFATRLGRYLRTTTEVTILADLGALAVLIAVTGGVVSPLNALLLTEVVAVTLLFGRWAGLRVSLLASIGILWLLASGPRAIDQAASAVRMTDPAVALALHPVVRTSLLLIALWATAFVTGWLADVIERDLRRRTEDLTLLRDVTPDLDPRQGAPQVAEALARLLVERLGHRAGAVWLAAGGRLELAAEVGTQRQPDAEPDERPLALDDELVATTLAGGRVQPVRRDHPRPTSLRTVFGERAPLALVPLTIDGRPIGLLAIEVAARLGRGPTLRVRQVRLLRMLGEQAALLLDNARLQTELAGQALTDAVTGLPNHRFLQRRLGEELERLARSTERGEQRVLSVALLDLDHFKRVNDTFGHPTGDRVLAAVASAADRTLRGSDVVCRYGGEEFAMILPDTDAASARLASERVRRAVAELRLTALDGRPVGPITVSIGIATRDGTTPDRSDVLAQADAALYEAKDTGRDRVVHEEDLPVGPDNGPDNGPDDGPAGPTRHDTTATDARMERGLDPSHEDLATPLG